MPSKQNLERLIQLVVNDRTVQAMQEFYADNASMQENNQRPRTGLPQLLEHEHQVLRKFKSIKAQAVEHFFITGDHAVIHWVFDFTTHDNRRFRLDELAYQTWEGEKIVKESFTMIPRRSGWVPNSKALMDACPLPGRKWLAIIEMVFQRQSDVLSG